MRDGCGWLGDVFSRRPPQSGVSAGDEDSGGILLKRGDGLISPGLPRRRRELRSLPAMMGVSNLEGIRGTSWQRFFRSWLLATRRCGGGCVDGGRGLRILVSAGMATATTSVPSPSRRILFEDPSRESKRGR